MLEAGKRGKSMKGGWQPHWFLPVCDTRPFVTVSGCNKGVVSQTAGYLTDRLGCPKGYPPSDW